MKAVICNRFAGVDADGKPIAKPKPLRDVLSLSDIPYPECDASHVLVDVHYAGIQYPDALQAQGLYQVKPPIPYVPGSDVTGIVREIGEGVSHIGIGDPVIVQVQTGGLAEVVKARADAVWKAPQGIDLAKCANLGRNYFAAYHSLKVIGEIGRGDLVLIDGASGGVGMAAIELAKAMGAQVIAGVGVPEKAGPPSEVGADRVFCYGRDRDAYKKFKNDVKAASTELGHPDGVDLVIDMVQGDLFEAALVSSVRPLGKLALVGFTAGQKPIRPGLLLIKQAAVVGSLWSPWARENPEAHQENVREILDFMAKGAFRPRADRVFPLKDFIQAFELFEKNEGRGNTVICIREV